MIYELYESDAQGLDHDPDARRHLIDRQVKLAFADASDVYVSWTSTPVQFAIGYQDQSFFVNEPDQVRDMTTSEM